MDLLDIAPSYPLTERENWRVLTFEAESGIEQRVAKWAFPKREWEVRYIGTNYSEVNSVREFLRKQYGGAISFFWKEPYQSSRNRVKMGYGDGSRTDWIIPVLNAATLVFHVNSTIVSPSVNSTGGQNGLGIATFSAPASGAPVDFDYTDGNLTTIVRLKESFQFNLQAPLCFGDMAFSIVETLEQTPES